jgi:1-acyl-sn-glycerol-3-phosphate acyltransferase
MMKKDAGLRKDAGFSAKRVFRLVSRVWRIAATGFSFVLLGLLASVLGLIVIPMMRLWPYESQSQEFRVQVLIRSLVRFYLFMLQALGTCTIRFEGKERLWEPGLLVVANHPTLLDALLLMSEMPQVDCVVKRRYFYDRFLGAAAQGAGYIPSGDGPAMVEACVDRLKQGRSIMIFPEGTRSPVNGLGCFTRGTAHISIRAQRDPVPVTILCNPPALYRGRKWWDVPERRFELILRVGDPLVSHAVSHEALSRGRAARDLTESLHHYYERELAIV